MRLRRGRCGASFCLAFGFLAGGGFRLALGLGLRFGLSALDLLRLGLGLSLDSLAFGLRLCLGAAGRTVPDDADDELLVLWEELPELAEEEDVLPEEPAWDEDELLVEPDSLVTPLPMVMVRVLLLTLQSL